MSTQPWPRGLTEHVGSTLLSELYRRRLVFVHSNPLVDQAVHDMDWQTVSVDAVLDGDLAADLDRLGGGLFVTGLEAGAGASPARGVNLSLLRAEVLKLLDGGVAVCLLSRSPKIAYPMGPGSSILLDCYVFHVDNCLRDEVSWRNVAIIRDGEDLRSALRSLGPSALAALDLLCFELEVFTDIEKAVLDNAEWEALRGAGLVSPPDDSGRYRLIPGRAQLRSLLAEVISESLAVSQELGSVVFGLAEIEHRLRRELRRAAVRRFGPRWAGSALPQLLQDDVLKRAAAERYSGVRSLKELRDPLEWLTLAELIDLARNSGWASRLGRPDGFWNRLASQVVPVRNRVSHMRLLRRQDEQSVRTWATLLVDVDGERTVPET